MPKKGSMARAKQLATNDAAKAFEQSTAAVRAGLNSTDVRRLEKLNKLREDMQKEAAEAEGANAADLKMLPMAPEEYHIDNCWEQHVDGAGRKYWWNSFSKESRWAKPKEIMQPGEKREHTAPMLGFIQALGDGTTQVDDTVQQAIQESHAAKGDEVKSHTLARRVSHSPRHDKRPVRDSTAAQHLKRLGRPYGIIVFGASGLLGRKILVELAANTGTSGIKIAAAGRSEERLKSALNDTGLRAVDILVADAHDSTSLLQACAQGTVLINCIGNLSENGEPVIQACIETQTAYVDLSEDPDFFLRMEAAYAALAFEREVLVIPGCGFHSVPSDEGVLFTIEKLGFCSQIESYLTVAEGEITGMDKALFDKANRDLEAFWSTKDLLPAIGNDLDSNSIIWEGKEPVKSWATKLCTADTITVRWSSFFRAMRYNAFNNAGNILSLVFKQFNGAESGGKRSSYVDSIIAKKSFQLTMCATGFREPDTYEDAPNLKVVTRVSGPDPSIVTAAICVVACAVSVLLEAQNLEFVGGVFTPSIALNGSNFRSRLMERGIVFELLEIEDTESGKP